MAVSYQLVGTEDAIKTPRSALTRTKLLAAARDVIRARSCTATTVDGTRAACDRAMSEHVADLTRDIEAARQPYASDATRSAESVGYFMRAVLQSGFIFAEAKQDPSVAAESSRHPRRYLAMLLGQPETGKET